MRRGTGFHIGVLLFLWSAFILSGCSGGGSSNSLVLPPGSITGTVVYQDKEYYVFGFTGNRPYKAVRYAVVDVVAAASSGILSSTVTDANGNYAFSNVPAILAYIRVNAEATPPGSPSQIQIKNLSGNIYGFVSNNFIPTGSVTKNITIPTTSIGGAFNILDVFTNGFQFVNSFAGTYPPSLSAYWQAGNPNGTYYCPVGGGCGAEGIYVLNYAGDTDEYDDDVLYHEFGHFTAAHFSKDDSQGGPHALSNNDLDMRLAWSEGWGDSMPGNIKLWLNATAPGLLSSAAGVPLTEYVDTYGNTAQIAFNMGNPGGAPYFYACGEVAIAKIILDLNLDFGMQVVWDVIADFKTNAPATPVNLDLFWDRWHLLSKPTTTASISMDSIFNVRQVFYADLYTGDTFTTATALPLSTPQVHYIYPDGGFDLVSFNTLTGQHYTITTANLKNGADTLITVYDPSQTQSVVAGNPNDNANGDTYSGATVPSNLNPALIDAFGIRHENGSDFLGSQLGFIASSAGPYYVKIQSSPNRPVSAGRYGTYTITLTNP
jgi:hypothetical protein